MVRTISFYNVENLFDTIDNRMTDDDDFTPQGRLHWTKRKYYDHLNKIARVLSQIGRAERKSAPDIIGLAEVENKRVLKDLIHTRALRSYNYGIIHYNSSDSRGIDVALLYKNQFLYLRITKVFRLKFMTTKETKFLLATNFLFQDFWIIKKYISL